MKNLKQIIRKNLLEASNLPEERDYMFFSNLEQIKRQCDLMLKMDRTMIDNILNNGHDWADDHMTEAKVAIDQVFDFIMNEKEKEDTTMDYINKKEGDMENSEWNKDISNLYESNIIYEDEYGSVEKTDFIIGDLLNEAEYQGRKVKLGKPFLTPDGPKKRSVYVKNKKGNVIKVNFGDPNMKIKKNIPSHRKSFRARHHCETATDRTTPRYWSCKFW